MGLLTGYPQASVTRRGERGSIENENEEGKRKKRAKRKSDKRKEKIEHRKGLERKPKNDKKESVEGKEVLMTSRRVVKRVLLAKKEPLYHLPTNMCLQLSTQFSDLPIGFRDMLGDFQELFPKYSTRATSH
ncbi:hypothetical protein CR513_48181, partial [Mucuna pruriens]